MSAEDILQIIEAVPQYIVYVYPGYLTIYCYYFLRGRTLRETNAVLVKALAISYIYLCAVENWNIPPGMEKNAVLIAISLVAAYISCRITKSRKIISVFNFLKINTTFYDNEMDTLAEFDRGAWLVVYLKDDDVVYEGSLGVKELEEGKRKYISLDRYWKYYLDVEGKPREPYIEDHSDNPGETAVIFYEDIKRVEKRDT